MPQAAITSSDGKPKQAVEEARKADRGSDRCRSAGNRHHQRRNRIRQPGGQGRGRDVSRKGRSHHHLRHRTQGDSRFVQAPRKGRIPRHVPAGRRQGLCRSRRSAQRDHRQDDPDLDHDRQQRSRRHSGHQGNRKDRARARRAVPHGCGSGCRQDSVQRERNECRYRFPFRSQDVRSERRRRSLCATPESARAADADHRWRRSRTRNAIRNAERSRHRGIRQGSADCARRTGDRNPPKCSGCARSCGRRSNANSTRSTSTAISKRDCPAI